MRNAQNGWSLTREAAQPRILLLALLPIGDTLFTTPTLRSLRGRYPGAQITALVFSRTAALMRCVPAIDDVVVLPLGPDWHGPTPLLRTVRALRSRRFDAAIDFTSPAYKPISLVCGISARSYLKVDPLFWLLPGDHAHWRATHATEHYYDAARDLDLPPWGEVAHTLDLRLPESARVAARNFLQRHGVRPSERPLVGLHAGGRWLEGLKCWPPARFAALAAALRRNWDARIVVLGGPDDAPGARAIARATGQEDTIVAAGALPLLASMAVVADCDLFVGDDSALLHAAAALGTPYVGIYGPTWPDNYRPVAVRPGQGLLALPTRPCASPQYFVGGSSVWHRPCCQGTCAALATVGVDAVLSLADTLLRAHRDTHMDTHVMDARDVPANGVLLQYHVQAGAAVSCDHARAGAAVSCGHHVPSAVNPHR